MTETHQEHSIMKTISLFFTAAFALAATCVNAQGSLERKPLETFNTLVVKGAVDVYVNQTNESGISASASDLNSLQYSVKNGTLEINGGSDGHIYVHTQGLSRIEVYGNSDVYSSDTLKGSSLAIVNSGAGDATLLLNYTDVDVNVTGSADVKLSGTANNLKADVSGAGDLRAYKMPVLSASVKLSGSGDAQINASKSIQGNVGGAGTLYHQGEPEKMEVEVTGAGEVKKSNALVNGDTTRIKFGNKKIIILEEDGKSKVEIGDDVIVDGEIQNKEEEKPKKDHPQSIWSGFEMAINGYMNPNNSFNMDSVNSAYSLNYNKSIAVNFNFWEVHGKILKNNIYVTTGLGAEINNYRFDKNVKMLSDTTPTVAVVEAGKDYDKSKLVTGYLNAPLYLTFATNKFSNGKRLSISPGVTAGWKFTSYNKRVVNENGDREKSHNHDDFNLNPFRVNASVRVGYGSFILFANYALTPLFQKNEGPDLTAFSAGIRVVGFGK
jgi:hypothetical protein